MLFLPLSTSVLHLPFGARLGPKELNRLFPFFAEGGGGGGGGIDLISQLTADVSLSPPLWSQISPTLSPLRKKVCSSPCGTQRRERGPLGTPFLSDCASPPAQRSKVGLPENESRVPNRTNREKFRLHQQKERREKKSGSGRITSNERPEKAYGQLNDLERKMSL